jgi:transposase-like protein
MFLWYLSGMDYRDEAAKIYLEMPGISIPVLARKYQVHRATLRKWARNRGIDPRIGGAPKRTEPSARDRKILYYRAQGRTFREIGDAVRLTRQAVHVIWHKWQPK